MTSGEKDLSRREDRIVIAVRGPSAERLDRHVSSALSWKSRARVQQLIDQGRVTVNGVPAKASRKVRPGDRIVVDLSGEGANPPEYSRLRLEILYEDPWLVAVDKPPGMLVHPVGPHVYDTLLNYLHHRYRGQTFPDGEPVRPRLCHRIDKETTGVVLVGKDTYVHNALRAQFEGRRISKEYVALVRGRYGGDGEIDIPIGEGGDLASSLDHRCRKPSRTVVRALRRYRDATLLSCVPATGRQNQIRIHLAAVGHPIVGDERFGSNSPDPGFPERYLLHSRRLAFHHPREKLRVELEAPLPRDFAELLERLP